MSALLLALDPTNDILSFYGWWQFSVCLFAFVALMSVWWHIGKKQNDFGQVWLALAVLCWSISGLVEVYFAEVILESSKLLDGWRSILSLFNSLFILLALPWFKYLPKPLEPIIKSNYWISIVGLPFMFCILPTISKMVSGQTLAIISELDVYYAFLTLVFLGYVLWESFAKRRLLALAWLSLVLVLIILVAQLYKLFGSSINLTLLSAIFKASLIMVFFSLALSWVKELSENIIPQSSNLKVEFNRNKNEKGRFDHVVRLGGIPGKKERNIILTPAMYDLFMKFAERKKIGENPWLEIKPKNFDNPNKEFDIKDHNEIKRLLVALLDGIFGKENWTKDQHLIPLKSSLFEMSEKRERKIKLSIDENNILL